MKRERPKLVAEHEAAGRYVEVRGQRIFVREEGEGPAVLLLHGVPASSFLYRKILPRLAQRSLRGVAFDFPGMGLSDKPRGAPYDWHALAGWTEDIVDALGLEDVHLVVHDIAGPIGVEWTIDHPTRVQTLTITNTLLDVASFHRPFPMNTFVIPGLRHLSFLSQSVPLFLPLMRARGVKDPSGMGPEEIEAYIWLLKQKEGKDSFLSIMAGFDLSPEHRDRLRDGLLRLGLPMQVVWGKHEVAIPKHQLDYIRETFPLEREHLVEARHFLQEDQAEEVTRHIADFVRTHAAQETGPVS
jgi:pimeloyl-ACP methyl ester carboxylesterase